MKRTNFGEIEECSILKDANGLSRGCAFITYVSEAAADKAIAAYQRIRAEAVASGQRTFNVKKANKERKLMPAATQAPEGRQTTLDPEDADLSKYSVERLALELHQRLALNKTLASLNLVNANPNPGAGAAADTFQCQRRTNFPRDKMRSLDAQSVKHCNSFAFLH